MAARAFQKIYTKITQITKATLSLKATGVGYDELATVNGKLAQVIHGQPFLLVFTGDARALALIPTEKSTDTIQFPKSGRKRIPDVTELLNKKKIPFPAQYEVWFNQEERFWQGDLSENPMREHSQEQQKLSPKSKRS